MGESPANRESPGVAICANLVEAFIFRRPPRGGIELLQMKRSAAAVVSPQTWQPVLGHIESRETAVEAVLREMGEETGLTRGDRLALWQLEQVHPFFIAATNSIYLCPRFVAEVGNQWEPVLNGEHDGHRWIDLIDADQFFCWPGQRAAIREFASELIHPNAPSFSALRLE